MTFYPPSLTATSRKLYDVLADRFADGQCTIIGGWAVRHLTTGMYQEESRDLDLVFHTPDAFNWFQNHFMRAYNLAWSGKRRKFNSCYQKDVKPPWILVDVFASSSDILTRRFAVPDNLLIKKIEANGWLPTVQGLLNDKLVTLPLRRNQDSGQKRFKDAIDSWALVFHNNKGEIPVDLREQVPNSVASKVQQEADNLRSFATTNEVYEQELEEFLDWIE